MNFILARDECELEHWIIKLRRSEVFVAIFKDELFEEIAPYESTLPRPTAQSNELALNLFGNRCSRIYARPRTNSSSERTLLENATLISSSQFVLFSCFYELYIGPRRV
ncbi:hypothetical protein WA026_016298 [Henosepilachna vigintioctopunctata]|uniref:PH domain-containing protein n=1 Tax=Henosepilachna vigintioctopunctata TaxID=420089 RepID=A0AAW1UFG3_9CUCU